MPTRLNLILDGNAPGLPEHALSIGAFGGALARLLSALQRIGSGMVKEAVGEEYGSRGGRHSQVGSSIDVEIVSLKGMSPLDIGFLIVERTPPGATLPLFDDLTDRVTDRFIEAVEQESQGRPYNRLVRRFLASMPPEVTSQQYISGTGRQTTVGAMSLPEVPRTLPYLAEFTGVVIGLGFEPGKSEVRFKTDDNVVSCPATPEQVEEALAYRGAAVRVYAVRGPKTRLLALGPVDQPFPVPNPEARNEYLFTKWYELLKRLAE